jgi:glutamyl-tRNA reductase
VNLSCVSVGGCKAPLDLLERLAFARTELAARLPRLRTAAGAAGLAVLSTCQRVEVYASWPGEPDEDALLAALADDRGVPVAEVRAAAATSRGDGAVRHLLRVATGLESFVLGETEIAGQVRAAAEAGRGAGGDPVLDRLLDTAVGTARRAHRRSGLAAASRSVAAVAMDRLAAAYGGLAGRRLLVVGAGQVAAVVADRGAASDAAVTICNRTRRHADRFASAGATVVDLAQLPAVLGTADVAVLATAAPHPLVDAPMLVRCRPPGAGPLTLVDLALPRNAHPSVRALPSVRLIDLADLRAAGAGALPDEIAAVEGLIEAELARYRRWQAGRSAAAAVRRMREDAEEVARQEIARADVPADARPALERAVLRTVHRLTHATTCQLLDAAVAGDTVLVDRLAGRYAAPEPSAADDPHAAAGLGDALLGRAALDPHRAQLGAGQQAADQGGVHPADQLAV